MRVLLLVLLAPLLSSCEAHGDPNYLAHNQLHPDITAVVEVTRNQTVPGGFGWADSYSVDDRCYCASNLDHDIAEYPVETPLGWMTVRQACLLLGPGPGLSGRPIYNDIQCGNGPPNSAGDEHTCPGRVDIGIGGCGQIGPEWNFKGVSMLPSIPSPGVGRDEGYWNTGREGEDTSIITGKSWNYIAPNSVKIMGKEGRLDDYRSHRSGPNFSYLLHGFTPNAMYTLRLGFAETYKPNCMVGKRVMSIKVNGVMYRDDLDVFKEAGCNTVYIETMDVKTNGLGRLRVAIGASVENAMISTIDVRRPSTQTAPSNVNNPKKLTIDAGTLNENTDDIQEQTWRYGVSTSPTIHDTTDPVSFRIHRSGNRFIYNVKGFVPGKKYKMTLGFAEIWVPNCRNGNRVFSVKVNGDPVIDNLDVFKKAGCAVAYIEQHLVTADSKGNFAIKFIATKENAMISLISINEDTRMGYAFVDAGRDGEDTSRVTGNTKRFGRVDSPEIAGTPTPVLFRQHRYGDNFMYTFDGFTPGKKFNVQLGFAEIFGPNCAPGMRKFQIKINSEVVESGMDVGASGGCNKALVKNYEAVADSKGNIELAFKAIRDKAMVSYIEITG